MKAFRLSLRDLFWLVLVAASGMLGADESKPVILPEEIARVLRWMPENTETLAVARSFQLERPVPSDGSYDLQPFITSAACGELLTFLMRDEEKYFKPLAGAKVKLAVCGGRDYESDSKFGSFHSENCSVVQFDKPVVSTAKEWIMALRADAKETRAIGTREVLVFPSETMREGTHKQQPWRGVYVVMVKPDTLLCATSDRYLEELLKRLDTAPQGRAVAGVLPQWKYVDPNAPAWMLRQIPSGTGETFLLGLTWSWQNDVMEVVYLPKPERVAQLEKDVRERWSTAALLSPKKDSDARIEQRKDGTVAVSFQTTKLDFMRAFILGITLLHLEGEDGRLGRP